MLNRKGYGYIWTCVLIVMLVMILSALMSVAETVSSVRHFKREITTALEAYSTTESIRIYSSIKNGNDRIGTPDNALFQQYLVSYCHLQSSPKGYVCLTSDHVERFQMSVPTLSFMETGVLKVQADFTVYVPLYYGGIKVTTATVPMRVETKLNNKF